MIKPRNLILSAVFVAISIAAFWQTRHPSQVPNNEQAESAVTPQLRTDVAKPPPTSSTVKEGTNAGSELVREEDDCLSPAQIETHPMLKGESERLDSVSVSGPTIASYRSLSAADLSDLAVQGDSAAMAVLGSVSVMRARGLAEKNAVPYLLFEDMGLHTYIIGQPLDAETLKHYEEARDWFYRSALYGRLLALFRVGEIAGILEGGPVGLGWIEKEEYESLKGLKRAAVDPATVYNALAFEIAPQLQDGAFAVIFDLVPHTERQLLILAELAKQFDQDREEAKLPPIVVPESTAPPMDEFLSLLCDSYINPEF
jgi:hypothetical protein